MSAIDDFVSANLPAAQAVAEKIGVDPHIILGQWGLETGWGQHVVPGTNNLGNVKGQGVAAVDNQTGSTDQYKAYASPAQFGSDFSQLITNKYPNAVNSGADAKAYGQALAAGGYAEDKNYASKLSGAVQSVRKSQGMDIDPSKIQWDNNAPQGDTGGIDPQIDTSKVVWDKGAPQQPGTTTPAPQQPIKATDDMSFGDKALAASGLTLLGMKQKLLDPLAAKLAASPVGQYLDQASTALGLPTTAQANAQTQSQIDQGERAVNGQPSANTALNHTLGGFVGNAGTNALMLALGGGVVKNVAPGLAQLAAANPYKTAATVGAALGYTQPTATGEGNAGNMLTGAIGGVGGQAAGKYVVAPVASAITNKLMSLFKSGTPGTLASADKVISDALATTGTKLQDLPQDVVNSLRGEVQSALDTGKVPDPKALARKADFATVGANPTLGLITRDPIQYTKEANLAKLGANGGPGGELTMNQAANNQQLISTMNQADAANAPGPYQAGNTLLKSTQDYIDSHVGKNGSITGLYNTAKDSQGRPVLLDSAAFANAANDALDKSLKGNFLPEQVRGLLNDFATGKKPLDVQSADVFKTILSNASKGAKDGNEKQAVYAVRDALDNTPMLQGEGQQVGQDAMNAFNAARAANKQFMGDVGKTPALNAVYNAENPDNLAEKFFEKQVINSPVSAFKNNMNIWQNDSDAMSAIKSQTLDYLKTKALNGEAEDTGKFGQASFNKALQALDDNGKLDLIFSPQEAAQLRAVGRVSRYMKSQPEGSAVNNSNTAGTLGNMLMNMGQNSLVSAIKKAPGVSHAFDMGEAYAAQRGVNNALQAKLPVVPSAKPVSGADQATNKLLRILGATSALNYLP